MTFFSGGFITEAARIGRRKIRPYFQSGRVAATLYDLITFATNKIILTYIVFPFIILEFDTSFRVYSRLYFSGHILLLAFIFLVPLLPNHPSTKKKE
jgi:lysophospholipid acyltransferase